MASLKRNDQPRWTPDNSADTFFIRGGNYVFDVVATFGGGNVTLMTEGPDAGAAAPTQIPSSVAITANGRSAVLALPSGVYGIAVVTATSVYAVLRRVPVATDF